MEFRTVTNSANETKALGRRLAVLLSGGDIISLAGDLGAGKTVFVQGLAEGLGIKEKITSPTFTIIKEYANDLDLYHLDVYRLDDPAELVDLGYEEYFFGDGVSVVEWGDRMTALFPPEYLEVVFTRPGEDKRDLTFVPKGPHWEGILVELFRDLKEASGG